MPNIRTYQNEDAGFTPNNMAPTSAGFAGNALRQDLSSAGSAIGQGIAKAGRAYVEHEAQAEISDLTARYAKTFEQLTQSWNETAKGSDPNDPDTGKKWREGVMSPTLEQLSEGLHTGQAKEHATRLATQLSSHMFEKTLADQSTIAGNAAVSNVNTLVNSLSNAVASDPSAMRGAIPMLEASADAIISAHPNLSVEQASSLRTRIVDDGKAEIAKSAALGMIDQSPDLYRAAADAGQFDKYLDASTIKSLNTYAESQQRAAAEAQRAAVSEQRRQQGEYVSAKANEIFANQIDPDTGQIHIQPDYFKQVARLALLPNAPVGLGRAMADFGSARIKEEMAGVPATTDPNTYRYFTDRMFLPAGDARALTLPEVYTARAQGLLGDKDFSFFKDAVGVTQKNPAEAENMKKLNTFLGAYKSTITSSSFMGANPQQDQMYYLFQTEMRDAFQRGIAAGKSPDDLLSPTSKDFLIKDLTRYTAPDMFGTDADALLSGTPQLAPMPPALGEDGQPAAPKRVEPRKPGETPAEYAKRMGL